MKLEIFPTKPTLINKYVHPIRKTNKCRLRSNSVACCGRLRSTSNYEDISIFLAVIQALTVLLHFFIFFFTNCHSHISQLRPSRQKKSSNSSCLSTCIRFHCVLISGMVDFEDSWVVDVECFVGCIFVYCILCFNPCGQEVGTGD